MRIKSLNWENVDSKKIVFQKKIMSLLCVFSDQQIYMHSYANIQKRCCIWVYGLYKYIHTHIYVYHQYVSSVCISISFLGIFDSRVSLIYGNFAINVLQCVQCFENKLSKYKTCLKVYAKQSCWFMVRS